MGYYVALKSFEDYWWQAQKKTGFVLNDFKYL